MPQFWSTHLTSSFNFQFFKTGQPNSHCALVTGSSGQNELWRKILVFWTTFISGQFHLTHPNLGYLMTLIGHCGKVQFCPEKSNFIQFYPISAGVYILSLNFKFALKHAERALKIFIFAPILCYLLVKLVKFWWITFKVSKLLKKSHKFWINLSKNW